MWCYMGLESADLWHFLNMMVLCMNISANQLASHGSMWWFFCVVSRCVCMSPGILTHLAFNSTQPFLMFACTARDVSTLCNLLMRCCHLAGPLHEASPFQTCFPFWRMSGFLPSVLVPGSSNKCGSFSDKKGLGSPSCLTYSPHTTNSYKIITWNSET